MSFQKIKKSSINLDQTPLIRVDSVSKVNNKSRQYCITKCLSLFIYILTFIICILITPLGGLLLFFVSEPKWEWCRNEIASTIKLLYETLIGVTWSTLFIDVINGIFPLSQTNNEEHTDDHHGEHDTLNAAHGDNSKTGFDAILPYILFCLVVYTIANILMLILVKTSKHLNINSAKSFYIGCFGHIFGFGLRNLSTEVLENTFFKNNDGYKILYLLILFIVFSVYLFVMDVWIRPKLCFIVGKVQDILKPKDEFDADAFIDEYYAMDKNNEIKKDMFETSLMNTLMLSKQKSETDIKESHSDISDDSNGGNHEFYELVKEIDIDAWTIALSFTMTQIIFVLYEHRYKRINDEEINEEIILPESYTVNFGIFYTITCVTMYFVWYVMSKIFSIFQAQRDRIIFKLFDEYQKNNTTKFKTRKDTNSTLLNIGNSKRTLQPNMELKNRKNIPK